MKRTTITNNSRILRMIHTTPGQRSVCATTAFSLGNAGRREGEALDMRPQKIVADFPLVPEKVEAVRVVHATNAAAILVSARLRKPAILAASVIALVAVVALTGCTKTQAQPKPMAPTVTVAPVEQREIVEWDEFTGRTAPVEFVEIRPRVSGHIEEVRFESGTLVKKGDVLVKIDPRWHQAEYDRHKA